MDIPYGDATMWGPQPEKARKRLRPGDRMTDGRIFMGDDPAAALKAALERVELELAPLEAKRDELLAKLAELAPDKPKAPPPPVEDTVHAKLEEPASSEGKPAPRKGKRGGQS